MTNFTKNPPLGANQVCVRTRVPIQLKGSDNATEFVSFKGLSSSLEHVALVFKAENNQSSEVPIVRLHSECLTGDIFHSCRCDCGAQLQESIQMLQKHGGILLYLRQEGRGIGLYNKLDAYVLQNEGMDTFEANRHLGFDDDLRSYQEAAQMLKALDVTKLKLLTNNARKRTALQDHGLQVIESINTGVFVNEQNYDYIKDKIELDSHEINL